MLEALQLGLAQAPTATPAVAGSGFDLTTVLASFGASVPLFLWLLKMHRDLISIVIPRGFRLIRREMRRQSADSSKRYREHLEFMKSMNESLKPPKRSRKAKSTSQEASRGQRRGNGGSNHPPKRRKRPRS